MRTSTQLLSEAINTVVRTPLPFVITSVASSALLIAIMVFANIGPNVEDQYVYNSKVNFAFEIISLIVWLVASLVYIKATLDPKGTTLRSVLSFIETVFSKYAWVSLLQGIIVGVGMIFLLIPGIYFAISLSFASFIVLVEDVRGVAALQRSYDYVKGRWFTIFKAILYFVLISLLIAFSIGFIIPSLTEDDTYLSWFVINTLSGLLYAVYIPYLYLMYQDIRADVAGQNTLSAATEVTESKQ